MRSEGARGGLDARREPGANAPTEVPGGAGVPPGAAILPLKSPGAFLRLDDAGLRCLRPGGREAGRPIALCEITHLETRRQGLWVGTRRTILVFRRSRFRDTGAPEVLARALRDWIARQPGGMEQLARMSAVDRLARAPARRLATRTVAVLCVVVFGLQLVDPFTLHVGAYVPELVQQGELWRVLTANFLHGALLLPPHLPLNLLCIVGFGLLVERPLGAARVVLIMAASGLGAMAGSHVAGYQEVIGASGIVAGLAGAVLCLELQWPERVPACWRLPRRLFVTVLLLQAVLDVYLPFVAGTAHLGGFVAGFAATRAVAESALSGDAGRGSSLVALRLCSVCVVVSVLLAFGSAAPLLMRDAGALERHAHRLLAVRGSMPMSFNEAAWRMVTESRPGPEGLALAVELAERAVAETDRLDPDVLDTLSEALFAAGDRLGALLTIDEAIAIAGDERYYVEQRRRFTGERPPEDRPAPPTVPWRFRPKPALPEPEPDVPGVSI